MAGEDINALREARAAIRKTMAIVLAGGRGSRLGQLTDTRAKPAVYFGGKFRIIDFALSNCVNSGVRRIGVVTQYKSHSLLKHLQTGWSFLNSQMHEFIDLLPAQQRIDEVHWYQGTADAVYQNSDIIQDYGPKYILILSGDHVYKMDYTLMLLDHILSGCRVSIGCLEVPREDAKAFGCMEVDETGHIKSFVEKPENPPASPTDSSKTLVSMGIYLFDAEYLYKVLELDHANPGSSRDFGKDVLPSIVSSGDAHAHDFAKSCVRNEQKTSNCYWRDVGSIESFWAANLDMAAVVPDLDVYDRSWPIWTYQEQLPPAKFVQDYEGGQGINVNTLVSSGCVISGSEMRNCVLFSSVRIHSKNYLEGVVAFPGVVVNRGCRIRNAIIDRSCVIPPGMEIGFDHESDKRRFHVSDAGITVVNRPMLEKLKKANPELFAKIPPRAPNRPRY